MKYPAVVKEFAKVRMEQTPNNTQISRDIKNKFKKDRLNVVTPNFKFDRVPTNQNISNISQLIYSISDMIAL